MGVSLERVQFKFASIIGELCNEPDVLSQFAVWLDIRLAEYKLKGAISLDCSGEEPDADWMNGLSKCKKYSANKRTDRQSSLHSPSLANTDSKYLHDFHAEHQNERLSPEFVVVKEEASDIFPVEVHMNANPMSSQVRKRSSFSNDWSRNSKQRRQNANESPAHQSLMSVIGHMQDETQESGSMGNNSSALISNSFKSSEQVTDIHIHQTQDPVKSPEVVTINIPDEGSLSDATSTQAEGTNYSNSNTDHEKRANGDFAIEEVNSPVLVGAWAATNHSRKMRIRNVEQLPKRTVINMVAGVGCFERWLWEQSYRDYRSMVDIPAEQLDLYLAEFFMVIKTPAGSNYKPESFQALKVSIDRYLQEADYADPPRTSNKFYRSLEAYRQRRRQLVYDMKYNNSFLNKTDSGIDKSQLPTPSDSEQN